MNKVLVNGIGTANELGICEACSLDFSWLVSNPSTLLWADEICIPKNAYDVARSNDDTKTRKVISMFLNMAAHHSLIKEINIAEMYQSDEGSKLTQQVADVSQTLLQTFPQTIKKGEEGVPGEIVIEDYRFCAARIAAIYMGMKVADDLDANCLFSQGEHTFLKYIYGLNANEHCRTGVSNAYSEVFSLYLPESIGAHNYAFTNEEHCQGCKHYDKCKNNYLGETEEAFAKMLKWRDYDELQQAKSEIDKIIRIKGQVLSAKDVDDVVRMFKERQERINRNINKRFPKIQRWTKMTTVLATPITITSAITGNVPLTIGSAVATGLSQITEEMMEIYKSKNNWVGFVNNMKEML